MKPAVTFCVAEISRKTCHMLHSFFCFVWNCSKRI